MDFVQEKTLIANRDGKEHNIEMVFINPLDMKKAIEDGTVTLDIPKYEGTPCSWYFEHWKECLLRSLTSKAELLEDTDFSDDEVVRLSFGALRKLIDKDPELNGLFWLSSGPEYREPMVGGHGWWTYYNHDTKSIELRHYETKEKLVESPEVFPSGKFEVEINIPSGKMVFGYYDVFQVWQDRDLQRENNASYFDSDLETKNFLELYSQQMNIVPFYRGYFDLYKKKGARSKGLKEIQMVEPCNGDPEGMTKLSSIEHDKMTCFCDLEEMLAKAATKKENLDGGDCPIGFDRETIIEASKEDSDYKRLDIIDVKKGRYKITLYRQPTKVFAEGTSEEMKEYTDYLEYTSWGSIEYIGE